MTAPTVFIVDDDVAVRDGLSMLLETDGLAVESFGDAERFLAAFDPARAGCLVLDVNMPSVTGPQLQVELDRRGSTLPIIFLTAFGDVPTSVRAMKAGAHDFLTKPADGGQLLERVHDAIARDHLEREQRAVRAAAREKLAALTPRERDVLALALGGLPNKEIARQLDISFRTVEVHRSRILLKTGAPTLLGLANLVAGGDLIDTARGDGVPPRRIGTAGLVP